MVGIHVFNQSAVFHLEVNGIMRSVIHTEDNAPATRIDHRDNCLKRMPNDIPPLRRTILVTKRISLEFQPSGLLILGSLQQGFNPIAVSPQNLLRVLVPVHLAYLIR